MKGYRNVVFGLTYIAACVWLGISAGPEQAAAMGNVYISLGIGVTGVVMGRGLNKWAEAKNGGTH